VTSRWTTGAVRQGLDLSHSQVSDLSPLRALTALEQLNVSWTRVAGVEALRELTRLEVLDVSGTHVVDLAPLGGLHGMKSFECRDSAVAVLRD
jgi:internalin A